MVVEIACTCDDLPAHNHIYAPNPPRPGFAPTYHDTGEVQIWVDWKAVARALSTETHDG